MTQDNIVELRDVLNILIKKESKSHESEYREIFKIQ